MKINIKTQYFAVINIRIRIIDTNPFIKGTSKKSKKI
jgi:hypothetical protein